MTQAQRPRAFIATLTAALLPALAQAHPGHAETSSFAAGVLHPLSGVDHVLGLVAVGVLAGFLGGRYLASLAAAFLGLLVAAWTADSEGWRYAAGFMASGATLVAAGVAATRLGALALTAAAPRSRT